MGTYDRYPGGGFREIGGYNPPSGAQADEERRQREREKQPQRQSVHQWLNSTQSVARPTRKSSTWGQPQRPAGRTKTRSSLFPKIASQSKKKKPRSSQTATDWSSVWAVLGFFLAVGWAANEVTGEDSAIAVIVAGVVGAVVGKKYYKAIFGFVDILRMDKSRGIRDSVG